MSRRGDEGGRCSNSSRVLQPRRRHSSIGYLSPIDYERRHAADPDAHELAAALAVKDKPSGRPPKWVVLAPLCGPGGKNGSARGRTKEWHQTGAQCHQTRYLNSPRNRGRSTGKGDGGTRLAPPSAKPSEWPGL